MRYSAHVRKLILCIVLIVLVITSGISGFMLIEDYTLREAFYMTIITISTVGFKEVHDLSPDGQLFTAFFIMFSLFTFAYLISTVSTYLFEGELHNIFKIYIINQDLKNVENHIIVCGFGRNGSKACEELLAAKEKVVVIEANENLLKERASTLRGLDLVLGDATQDDILLKAGLNRAKAIITTLPKDADNVFVALTARELNQRIRIIARASDKNTESKLIRAGADSVVMPEEIGGIHMANLVIRPDVIHFLEMIDGLDKHKLRLEELEFKDLPPELQGKSLQQLGIKHKTGATVIGLKNRENEFTVSPNLKKIISEGEILLVLGTHKQINALNDQYRHQA